MHSLKFRILLITGIFIFLISGNKAISQTSSIRINEFMAINKSIIADEDGDYTGWIELYNPSPYNIDLTNWSLTDSRSQPRKWVFPSITLRKGCYLLVFTSGKNRRTPGEELHANFNLNGKGEYLALYSSSESKVTEFYPSFPLQKADISYGFWNGEYKDFTVPTPGRDNDPSSGTLPSVPAFSAKQKFCLDNGELTPESAAERWNMRAGEIDKAINAESARWGDYMLSPLANQYTGGLSLTESSHIKARVFHNNEWSATTEQFFVVPENFHDLKITEINYHPLPDASGVEAEYEFIEIKNTGSSVLIWVELD